MFSPSGLSKLIDIKDLVSVIERPLRPSEQETVEAEIAQINRETTRLHAILASLSESELKNRMERLSTLRASPSNTLFRALQPLRTQNEDETIQRWSAANRFVLEAAVRGDNVNWSRISEIAALLNARFRTGPAFSGNCDYPDAADLPALVEIFNMYVLEKIGNGHPIGEAAKLYQFLISAHFFNDANGRIARFVAEWRLTQANYPPIAFATDTEAFVSVTDHEGRFGPAEAILSVCLGIRNSISSLTSP